jgi:hypothetical protein
VSVPYEADAAKSGQLGRGVVPARARRQRRSAVARGRPVYRLRPPEAGDAEILAPRLRRADLDELEASHGTGALEALLDGVRLSQEAWTMLSPSGRVAGMCGVTPDEQHPEAGRVWLLGSDELSAHPRAFLEVTSALIEHLAGSWGVLYNAVDERYGAALRWLGWLGFEPVGRVTAPVSGAPFLVMARESAAWVARSH